MTAALEQDVEALAAPPPAPLVSVSEPLAIRVLLIEDGVTGRGFKLSKHGFAVQTVASLADIIVLRCGQAKKSSIELLVKLHRLGEAGTISLVAFVQVLRIRREDPRGCFLQ
jgi:hypothetical protein